MKYLTLAELREQILRKFRISKISPSDCQFIALEITRKTKKNISVTTIKRIFGFAAVNHKFSKFTLSTLLDFLGDNDCEPIDSFLEQHPSLEPDTPEALHEKSKAISKETFKVVIENANIPFSYTIDRKFASHDFETFYESDYAFTAFIGQSGYGKSILISHLVQQNFLSQHARYPDDIILYLTAEKLFYNNRNFIDLELRIFELLGIRTQLSLAEYTADVFEKTGRKLIIVLDSLYPACEERGSKQRVFNAIVQFLANVVHTNSIKFIFAVRTYIWRRFYENIKLSVYLQRKWFKGTYYTVQEQNNIPVFSLSEIRRLLEKLGSDEGKLHPQLLSELKYPFNYANFYQLRNHYDLKKKLIYYKLLHQLVIERFQEPASRATKLMICKIIVEMSNFGKHGDTINKSLLIADFYQYKDAYMQLLLAGTITEEKHEFEGFQIEMVKFTQPGMFDYFLAKVLAGRKGVQYYHLIKHLHLPYTSEAINWMIFNVMQQKDYHKIKEIFKLKLAPGASTEAWSLVSEMLITELKNPSDSCTGMKLESIGEIFVDQLAQLDFLAPAFIDIANTIIKTSNKKIIRNTCHNLLTLHDCLTLNLLNLERRLAFFNQVEDHYETGCIDPLALIKHAIAKLTCHNYNRSFLKEQYQSLLDFGNARGDQVKLTEVTLCLMEWLFDDGDNLINNIADGYLKPENSEVPGVHFEYIVQLLRLNSDGNIADKMQMQLEGMLYRHRAHYLNRTFFGNALDYLIKIHQHIDQGHYLQAKGELSEAIAFYKQHGYKFLEIKSYKLGIVIFGHLGDQDRIIEYRYLILSSLEAETHGKYRFKGSLVTA
ncbi:hypothetical protein [Pedobacter sandarakinus]|uniref:hypothetical protein n=1 Tax=Pedobacter sandarakinus TaxID=353156 RepID=UPI002247FBF9|nr:hypothetical protein [Pedobacter sandarakinus]MCX2575098.1 hypothetical protein [Pedobacter sandarakinus]